MKPYYEHAGITIYHGDCREILPELACFDLLLTDPPYGIGADKPNAHSSIRDNDRWPNSEWDSNRPSHDLINSLLKKAERCAIWGGNYFASSLPCSSCWLAWIKPQAETGFSMADMELCWTNLPGAARVKTLPRRDGHLHPTQKPLALMSWCLSFFLDAKNLIDPFMGSGTSLRAAKNAGLLAVGIEINEAYCEIAAKRLSQEVLPLTEVAI